MGIDGHTREKRIDQTADALLRQPVELRGRGRLERRLAAEGGAGPVPQAVDNYQQPFTVRHPTPCSSG